MEKAELTDILDVFKHHLKDSLWSKYFYLSLCDNYWYNVKEDSLYFNSNSFVSLCQEFCIYRLNNLFIDEDYIKFIGSINNLSCERWRKSVGFSQSVKWRGLAKGKPIFSMPVIKQGVILPSKNIHDSVSQVNEFKQFIVLPINKENYNYIKS